MMWDNVDDILLNKKRLQNNATIWSQDYKRDLYRSMDKRRKNLQNVNKRLSLDSGIMGDFYSLYFFPIFTMHIHYFGSQEQYCWKQIEDYL